MIVFPTVGSVEILRKRLFVSVAVNTTVSLIGYFIQFCL